MKFHDTADFKCAEPGTPAHAASPPELCDDYSWRDEKRLCAGLQMIRASPCSCLRNVSHLANVIRSIGLVHDARECALYGPRDCPSMVPVEVLPDERRKSGIYHSPAQLAAALAFLSTLKVHSYLELGIHTGWTAALITAVLDRSHALHRGWAIDVNPDRVRQSTRDALRRRSTSVHHRREMLSLIASLPIDQRPIDLCFIDADHSYDGVRVDYLTLAPHCRVIMFHDIVDGTARARGGGGGVPAFWSELVRTIDDPGRVREFVEQPERGAPRGLLPALVFGIGVVLAGSGSATLAGAPESARCMHGSCERVPGSARAMHALLGYCNETGEGEGDCASGSSGSWSARELGIDSVDACATRCATSCSRCRYVSFSLAADDCSWFRTCNLGHLHSGEDVLPDELQGSFVSMQVHAKPKERQSLPERVQRERG